ncbi:MAG: Benzoate 1,2-dioxygenase electron transfer component [Firmicutes bacterium]|nr:Benzoate 1,2-dioxygenase electron transfer component [candidate division NPL-UPA2 bacterium]
MSFLNDFLPILSKSKLQYLGKEHEVGNVYSFYFQADKRIKWKAGQHGIFSIPKPMSGRAWRGFSVASPPGAEKLRIATRVSTQPSPYKQALMQLTEGEHIFMRGPFGPFYLDESKRSVVFVAGGIGVTPYRALISEALHNDSLMPTAVRLLYADNRQEYPFRTWFDKAGDHHQELQLHYLTSTSLDPMLVQQVKEFGNTAYYFVAGPVQMVRSITASLRQQGIQNQNIRHDMFFGL